MAAIDQTAHVEGKLRRNRLSTRVDMTPMVDLGFLLITFFMLATTMSKPTSMSVFFPDKNKDKTGAAIKASGVLTIFLGANNHLYYLDGIAAEDDRAAAALQSTQSVSDLRKAIFSAQRRVSAMRTNQDLIVVIKPTAVSTYKNMVDVMDEMAITRSKRYALVDELTSAEMEVLGDRILNKNP